jgi:A/G-specific adenine glycosylase
VALARSLSELDRMPVTVNDLLRLPAVGRYTAAAVACFSGGRAVPALDVNVARIIARVHGIQIGRGELRRSEIVMALANRLLKGALSRRLNWALLDLGALVCRPKPNCVGCPLIERCAYANAQLDRLITTSAS